MEPQGSCFSFLLFLLNGLTFRCSLASLGVSCQALGQLPAPQKDLRALPLALQAASPQNPLSPQNPPEPRGSACPQLLHVPPSLCCANPESVA